MKQVVQHYGSGATSVLDVPPPACKPGGVLVRTAFSLISAGTEATKVAEAKMSLLGKARARPDQVQQVLTSVAQQGPMAAYRKAMARLDCYSPLGYSLSGVVTEVGAGAEEFTVGQRVACAGNQHALHAAVNWVPRNLCVPVPEGVDLRHASFATVGAIALHGVRRGEVQLGETACVVGLGLIGQLVTRLLVAAGVRVVAFDPRPDRCAMGEAAGALACAAPDEEGVAAVEAVVARATAGLGVDHVFLAASGATGEPVRMAGRLARDRARIVDIGKCRLDLPWNAYYDKELELRLSRSYGPGRYDDRYELDGVDYPAGYVRWTERRNLACFLDLVSRGTVDLEPLISGVHPVDDAATVYEQLVAGDLDGVGFLFSYDGDEGPTAVDQAAPHRRHPRRPTSRATVRIGFLGAGNFASSTLLPHLAGRSDVELAHVVTTTSLSAANAQRRFGFARASTDASALLDDSSIDAVFVVTRHQSHADLACRALECDKAVFVEKPLALSDDELDRIRATVLASGNDRLMVGFNRRFAPLLVRLRTEFGDPGEPAVVRYLVNAGPLPTDSWYADARCEGSRFEGEGGHFVDTVSWWLGEPPSGVQAMGASGGVVVNLAFPGGSVATIAYVTGGNPRYPKETFEASAGGRTARLDNFRRISVWRGRRRVRHLATGGVDKGHRAQLDRFVDAVRSGEPMPIPLASLEATTAATLAVGRSLASGCRQPV